MCCTVSAMMMTSVFLRNNYCTGSPVNGVLHHQHLALIPGPLLFLLKSKKTLIFFPHIMHPWFKYFSKETVSCPTCAQVPGKSKTPLNNRIFHNTFKNVFSCDEYFSYFQLFMHRTINQIFYERGCWILIIVKSHFWVLIHSFCN